MQRGQFSSRFQFFTLMPATKSTVTQRHARTDTQMHARTDTQLLSYTAAGKQVNCIPAKSKDGQPAIFHFRIYNHVFICSTLHSSSLLKRIISLHAHPRKSKIQSAMLLHLKKIEQESNNN